AGPGPGPACRSIGIAWPVGRGICTSSTHTTSTRCQCGGPGPGRAHGQEEGGPAQEGPFGRRGSSGPGPRGGRTRGAGRCQEDQQAEEGEVSPKKQTEDGVPRKPGDQRKAILAALVTRRWQDA